MDATNIALHIDLLQPLEFASQGDLFRYVERTRRQLDRYNQLPDAERRKIAPADAARIRAMCDGLEADILKGLSTT